MARRGLMAACAIRRFITQKKRRQAPRRQLRGGNALVGERRRQRRRDGAAAGVAWRRRTGRLLALLAAAGGRQQSINDYAHISRRHRNHRATVACARQPAIIALCAAARGCARSRMARALRASRKYQRAYNLHIARVARSAAIARRKNGVASGDNRVAQRRGASQRIAQQSGANSVAAAYQTAVTCWRLSCRVAKAAAAAWRQRREKWHGKWHGENKARLAAVRK